MSKLLTYDEYRLIARKIINRYSLFSKMDAKFLFSGININYVVAKMMEADNKYDETRGASVRTHRYNYAIMGIKTLVREKALDKKRAKQLTESQPSHKYEYITDYKDIHFEEYIESLSEKEQSVLRMFCVYNMNFVEIGKIYGITRQRVLQIFNKSIDKLRAKYGK